MGRKTVDQRQEVVYFMQIVNQFIVFMFQNNSWNCIAVFSLMNLKHVCVSVIHIFLDALLSKQTSQKK